MDQSGINGAFFIAKSQSAFTDSGSKFIRGTVSGFGGALYVLDSSATLEFSVFDSNVASDGGTIFAFNKSPIIILNSTLKN
jgi:hypothetical protein